MGSVGRGPAERSVRQEGGRAPPRASSAAPPGASHGAIGLAAPLNRRGARRRPVRQGAGPDNSPHTTLRTRIGSDL
jgi:hypothetical protein